MSITTAGRSLSNDMVAVVTASQLSPILLASLSFSTPVNLWSGYGTITVGGTGYLGMGTLGTISPIAETTDLAARGITMQLSGVPTALIAVALAENYQGKECSVLFGALDASGALVSSPVTIFAGRMDVMSISDDGQNASIGMSAENKLVDFRRPREVRYTHEEQQNLYPPGPSTTTGDLGLEFVTSIQEKQIYWGNAKLSAPINDGGAEPEYTGYN
jgi:hypothetical protein